VRTKRTFVGVKLFLMSHELTTCHRDLCELLENYFQKPRAERFGVKVIKIINNVRESCCNLNYLLIFTDENQAEKCIQTFILM
jgi:hypothetical protein